MYTPLSWYFVATEEASSEAFLDVVEDWLTSPERKTRYGFEFVPHLREITNQNEFYVGEDCSLEVVKTEDEDYRYTSISVEKRSENKIWVVECVYREPVDGDTHGSFVVHYRKRTLDPLLPAEYFDSMKKLPRLPEYLIRAGLATKEEGEVFRGMLEPTTHAQEYQLGLLELPYYPIVTLNVARDGDKNYVNPSCLEYLSRYHTFFHMIVRRVEDAKKPEKWAIRVEYPRLRYVAEYYSYSNFPDSMRSQRVMYGDEDGRGYSVSIPLPAGFLNKPRIIVKELINLVGEGLSCFSRLDRKKVEKIFGRNKCAKRIPITEAMGRAISAARRSKGLTQSDLARATEIEGGAENAMNGLLISRIELARLKRIEVSKLEILEKCLGLPRGKIWDYAENAGMPPSNMVTEELRVTKQEPAEPDVVEDPVIASMPTGAPVSKAIKFCAHCGSEFPISEAKFCPYCGMKKMSFF